MNQDTKLTDAQERILDQIQDLMREHFDAGLLVIESIAPDNEKQSIVRCIYHGGYCTALGLVELAKRHIHKILESNNQTE